MTTITTDRPMADHVTVTTVALGAKCSALCAFIVGAASFAAKAIPLLQFAGLLISCIAGVISIILSVRALRRKS